MQILLILTYQCLETALRAEFPHIQILLKRTSENQVRGDDDEGTLPLQLLCFTPTSFLSEQTPNSPHRRHLSQLASKNPNQCPNWRSLLRPSRLSPFFSRTHFTPQRRSKSFNAVLLSRRGE